MSDLVSFMALWENQTKDGKTYVSGYLGDASIVGFKNEGKTSEKAPDWKFYIGKGKRQKEFENQRSPAVRGQVDERSPSGQLESDSIPF